MRQSDRSARGFTLIELLVVIAIIALLISLLLPALGEARKAAKLSKALSNLHQMAVSTQSYTTDFQDRLWSFTWRRLPNGTMNYKTQYGDLMNAADDMQAARFQMADIIRRRGDRPDYPSQGTLNLFPHLQYSHLVLIDYMAFDLPNKVNINPEDRNRDKWSSDPHGYDAGLYAPNLGTFSDTGDPHTKRHPYGSSFRIVAATVDLSPRQYRMYPAPQSMGSTYYTPGLTRIGGRSMSEISFPSQKVHMHDTFGRHHGRLTWDKAWIYKGSKQPLAMFDASASVRSNSAANEGCINPRNPLDMTPLQQSYTTPALSIEPDPPTPMVYGRAYYAWTRGGLKGVDFGGKEVRTMGN